MTILDDDALDDFRGPRCAWCHRTQGPFHCHHVFSKGAGQLDIRENLVCLCPTCHTAHHYGASPKRADLLALVAEREGTTPDGIERLVYALRRLPKGAAKKAKSLLLAFRRRSLSRRPSGATALRVPPPASPRGPRCRIMGRSGDEIVGRWIAF